MPLVTLPLRTSVIDVDGARVLSSPASTLRADELAAMGTITHIVAPNLYHLEGVPAAARAHPSAEVWAPRGAKDKLGGVAIAGTLGHDPLPFAGLRAIHLAGMPKVEETVLFDEASKTLFVADLVFNIERAPGLGAKIVYGIFGTYQRFGVSRLFTLGVSDATAFRRSVAEVRALDVERIVMAHGAIVEHDAKGALDRALAERGY